LAKEGKPDLICLDVQMPGMNGFEVFKALREDDELKSVPVIMITGVGNEVGVHFSADEVGNMLGTKPEGYLEKPVDAIQLQKLAGSLLGMGEEDAGEGADEEDGGEDSEAEEDDEKAS
jgi:CheY-like chemotaxis protein